MGDLRAKALLVAVLACGVGLFYVLEVRPPIIMATLLQHLVL
jgi:uncharacterized oligopeptide transporter (OPT) family protein